MKQRRFPSFLKLSLLLFLLLWGHSANAEMIYTDTDSNKSEGAKEAVLESDGTVNFANQKWDVIKGPDQMGTDNYLIAMQTSIETSIFSNSYYFVNNDLTLDGYRASVVKLVIDNWYNKNIFGTDFERYVQPVIINNPILEDMMKPEFGGWISNLEGGSIPGFLATNQPEAFPTVVGGSKKQAFLMSGSDVSNGQGSYGDLTKNALVHNENLYANGVLYSWLRSPGFYYFTAACLRYNATYIGSYYVNIDIGVVPSLIVRIQS